MDKSKKEEIHQFSSPQGDQVVERIPEMYPSILTNYRFPQKLAQQLQNNFSATQNSISSKGKKSPATHSNKKSLTPISHILLSSHLEKEKLQDKKVFSDKEQVLERESHISQKTLNQFLPQQQQQHLQNKSTSPNGRLALPQLSQKYATHSQESIMKAIKVYMPYGIPDKEQKERQTRRRLAALKNIKNQIEPQTVINTPIPLGGSLSIPHFKPQFLYVIDKGNNSQIVRRILSTRDYWTEAPNQFSNYHFRWKPTSNGIKFQEVMFSATKKQMVNHIEGHQEISIKSKLYLNIKTFQKDIDKIMPKTLLLGLDSAEIFERDLKIFVDTFFQTEQTTPKLKNVWLLKPDDLNRGQGISVFNTLSQLLLLLLPFGFPESVKIVLGSICSQAVEQLDNKNEDNKEVMSNECKKGLSDLNEKTQKRSKIPMGSNYNPGKVLVLQKYIENPMLIHERKFDIRAWVLVDADYQFYLFKEGYLRLSSEPFSLKAHTLQDKFVHLTNNAIQKTGKNYGKFENGNILSYQDYEAILKEKNIPFTLKQTFDQMKSLVRLSFASTRKKLFKRDKKSCFEIFGYDFLLQEDGQVFLIEANTNPCIEESNQLLANLIPRMLNDAFRITIDRVFPVGRGATPCDLSRFALDGYAHTDNLWEIIGTMNIAQAGLQISETINFQPNSLKSPKKPQKLTGSFSAAVIGDQKEEQNTSSLPSINQNNPKETNAKDNTEQNPNIV